MNLGHILFSFSGRINRAKWWLSILIIAIFNIVVGYVLQNLPQGASIIGFIVWLIGLWMSLAIGAKRLHDLNRSGAWLVLFIGGPLLLLVIFFGFAGMSVGTALLTGGDGQELSPEAIAQIISQVGGIGLIIGVLWLALAIWALIWFGCLRGTVGPNQYGPDPLEGRI
jgi:uncharacterized membrane protein YhaH (DUF805 family)